MHFSPFFCQILQIYLKLTYFYPYFQIFGAARAFFRGEEIQKSESGEGKKFDKIELYLPVMLVDKITNITGSCRKGSILVENVSI